jgi:uncharacterized protein (DUF2249 family)/SAM-dependent methyltransferase
MAEQELDVRLLRKPDKHPAIFAAYGHLPVGETFVLVNNHDPKHLREEFEADHGGSYGWEYLEEGPQVWRIRIARLATTPLPRIDAAGTLMTHGQSSTPSETGEPRAVLPLAGRGDDTVAGHWLLARLGKRVLRPGGAELTRAVLARAEVTDADVVELAPGLGRTAAQIIAQRPRSYVGVEQDPDAARAVRAIVGGHGSVQVADASSTGLPSGSVDVVIGEAMLTMQADTTKNAIIAEAARLLRPGGRYAIHELALTPDTVSDRTKAAIHQGLARSIRVNARPLTVIEWQRLLSGHGLLIDHVETAPMALLQLRRLIADEGLLGALRFATNLLTRPVAGHRVLRMRRTFREHRDHLLAVAVIAHKPDPAIPEASAGPAAENDCSSRADVGRIS